VWFYRIHRLSESTTVFQNRPQINENSGTGGLSSQTVGVKEEETDNEVEERIRPINGYNHV